MVENHRLRLAALVHHPLSLEMGLSEAQARTLQLIEQGSLARVQRVIVTSPATAETLLADFHVTPDRLGVVEPGTDRPETDRSARRGPARTSPICSASRPSLRARVT